MNPTKERKRRQARADRQRVMPQHQAIPEQSGKHRRLERDGEQFYRHQPVPQQDGKTE